MGGRGRRLQCNAGGEDETARCLGVFVQHPLLVLVVAQVGNVGFVNFMPFV